MKKAVIYARYSSDNQTEQSIEGQVRVCKEYAERNDFVVVNEYIDRAMTGTNDNRPALQQMLYDSKKKGFDFVLVYKFDRFARSRYDSAMNKAILKQNGVKLLSATEQISDNPEGIILEGMLESIAEYYSAELSQKVKRGQKESRIKGQFTGGPTPYGYVVKDKKVYIDEEEANIVRLMFNEYLSGKIIKDIVKLLKNKGIKNSYGKEWTINSVSRVLRNPNYKGCMFADDTCYTNIFPQIIDTEIFDEVGKKLTHSKRTSAHHKTDVNYILSGKLICGKCGALMTGDCGKGKLGKIYNYYKCFAKKKNRNLCDKKSVGQEYIENKVIFATKQFLNCTDLRAIAKVMCEVYNKDIEKDKILESLNKELQDNNKKLANLLRAVENGVFNDTTNSRMKELENSNKELQEKISIRQLTVIKPLDENLVYDFLCSFKDIDENNTLAKQRMIDLFVNRVVLVDNGTMTIYYNSSGDKGTQLDIKDQPDIDTEIEYIEQKKNNPNRKGSDYSRMAESECTCTHNILS